MLSLFVSVYLPIKQLNQLCIMSAKVYILLPKNKYDYQERFSTRAAICPVKDGLASSDI